jgi:hypothetical protein
VDFLKGFSFSKANSIGVNKTPPPIGSADQICRMNFQPIVVFEDFLGGSTSITYSKSQLDAPIYCIGGATAKSNILCPLCLFVKTSPFNLAVASGNGNRVFQGNNTFKLQITLNSHSPRPMLNYCLLPLTHFIFRLKNLTSAKVLLPKAEPKDRLRET